jgi:hypothetical protein
MAWLLGDKREEQCLQFDLVEQATPPTTPSPITGAKAAVAAKRGTMTAFAEWPPRKHVELTVLMAMATKAMSHNIFLIVSHSLKIYLTRRVARALV